MDSGVSNPNTIDLESSIMTNTNTDAMTRNEENGTINNKFSIYLIPGVLTLLAGLSTGFGGIIAVYFLSKETNQKQQKIQLGKWMSVASAFMICVTCFELIPTIFEEKNGKNTSMIGGHEKDMVAKQDNNNIDFFSFCLYSFFGAFLVLLMKKVIPEVNIENLVTGVYGDSQTNYYYRNEKGDERKIEKENHKEINRVSVLESQLTKERQSKGNQNEMKNLQDLFRSGLFAALAICVHNFPEGIATMLSTLHGGKYLETQNLFTCMDTDSIEGGLSFEPHV